LAVTLGGICPQQVYIKGTHNTVADAILQLEYDPKLNKTNEYTHAMLHVEPEELSVQGWKSFAHHWRSYNETSMPMQAYCFHMNEGLQITVTRMKYTL
jgi:hypothetical protein